MDVGEKTPLFDGRIRPKRVSFDSSTTPGGRTAASSDSDLSRGEFEHRYPEFQSENDVTYCSINSPVTVSRSRQGSVASRLGSVHHNHLALSEGDIPFLLAPTLPKTSEGKQGSLVTVFSIWNTMMGTSLLSMPWAIEQAGFGLGIALILATSALSLYTAYRVMNSVNSLEAPPGVIIEFSDICKYHLGRVGEYSAVAFSLVALLGGAIVYWVLMSNFLFTIVTFVFDKAEGITPVENASMPHNVSYGYLKCSIDDDHSSTANVSAVIQTFDDVWDLTGTVPFFLLILLVPLINFKSPTFFTKFTALGTVSVVYILGFITYRAVNWKFHIDFDVVPNARAEFPVLTGILALGFFIHNCILSIVRNQGNPRNNGRDLCLGYVCVCFTYLYVGIVFYSTWPIYDNDCIQDNLLNNFDTADPLALVARIFLFFQMLTVYPLLLYILRLQFMHTIFGDVWPSLVHILVFNAIAVCICLLFAKFMPHIGTIIRYTGALSGFAYAYTLPCLVYMLDQREKGQLTVFKLVTHSCIILLGMLNFIGQFLV